MKDFNLNIDIITFCICEYIGINCNEYLTLIGKENENPIYLQDVLITTILM
jgi:hypothetical protein